MLTIAIPTYNRNETLAQRLRLLLPQLTARCKLLIVDNCSDVPVAQTLEHLWKEFPQVVFEIVRNKRNIGMGGNISRCFELCETEWLWTLSDDDIVKPEAIEIIFEHISKHPDCIFFNFDVEHSQTRSKTHLTRGQQEFVESIEFFGNAIFLSSGVYRSSVVSPNTRVAYHNAYSMAPQFAIVLHSLGEKGLCCWSHTPIVVFSAAPPDQTWSKINFALGVPTLLDAHLAPEVRQSFAKVLFRDSHKIVPHSLVVHHLMVLARENSNPWNALYLYDQICHRRFYGNQRFLSRIKLTFWRTLLRFPRIGHNVLTLIHKIRSRTSPERDVQDRFDRQ